MGLVIFLFHYTYCILQFWFSLSCFFCRARWQDKVEQISLLHLLRHSSLPILKWEDTVVASPFFSGSYATGPWPLCLHHGKVFILFSHFQSVCDTHTVSTTRYLPPETFKPHLLHPTNVGEWLAVVQYLSLVFMFFCCVSQLCCCTSKFQHSSEWTGCCCSGVTNTATNRGLYQLSGCVNQLRILVFLSPTRLCHLVESWTPTAWEVSVMVLACSGS